MEFLQHVVYVILCGGLVADDAAEEVGAVTEWLVIHHQGTTNHHLGFYARGNLWVKE